jgi:hypothetical protein
MEKCLRNIQKFQAQIFCLKILKPAQNILAPVEHFNPSTHICIYKVI